MKSAKMILSLLFLAAILLAFPGAARADGIIIPDPPICDPVPCPPRPPISQLDIRYHHVTVTIDDQVATTHVDQVFYNPNNWTVEGTYIFPIPPEAAVSAFVLWVDGEPVEGKVLDADEARRIYEEIVASQRDPALLEYVGRGAVQARVFPISPQGERRIELEYSQALVAENGLVRYVYPLSTEKFSMSPIKDVSVSVDIRSSSPIRAVYSPSHAVDIAREDDHHVLASYEENNVTPTTDFSLYYSIGTEEAFHLLTYRDPDNADDPDGFFLALLAPKPEALVEIQAKDMILVIDRSGSMEGEKFQQARAALDYILEHLNPEDRFNIVIFSSGIDLYASGLRPAEEASEAKTWLDTMAAMGSTDLHRALLEAAEIFRRDRTAERPQYLIFLTDGLPTTGVVDSEAILRDFAKGAPEDLRLFAFGVGYDVDTYLLDSLAQAHHGTTTYVQPGERLDEILSAFYAKISTPVLTNLELEFEGVSVYDLYPQPLPDLFSGSQIVVVGRYRQSAREATVTLSGEVNGQRQEFTYRGQRFEEDSPGATTTAAIPRLWATRKIGYLLNQVRLNGPDQETIDQIVRLSIRYGIVTPYTSYLVTEPMPLGAAEQERIAEEQYKDLAAAPTMPASGQAAVEAADSMSNLAGAESASAPAAEASGQVKIVGSRTFVLNNGVWTDTAFDPDEMKTVAVPFLSADYFKLANNDPELAAAFALGEKVIALSDGKAYEIVASDAPADPVEIAPTPTEAPAEAATPQPEATPISAQEPASEQKPAGNLPCGSVLLPLGLLAVGFALKRGR